MAGRKIEVQIIGDSSSLERAFRRAETSGGSFGSVMGKLGKLSLLAGGGIAAGFAVSVKAAASFQQQLNTFQAVTQATGAQMSAVGDEAKALGADMTLPATSASDAAAAMIELSKAGISVADTMDAAKGVLQLSAAAGVDNATAAQITANALNAFNLKGTEATHVADLLAAASISSSGEITDMADALKLTSSTAAQAHIPIEDVTAAIAEMANKGILGGEAGAALQQVILKLEKPTLAGAAALKSLGVEVYNSQGGMNSLRSLIEQVSASTQGLSDAERNHALNAIFGSRAIRAANIVLDGGTAAFDKSREAVDRQGAAADLANAKMKGFSGSLEGLKSAAETLAITIGTPFLNVLSGLVRGVTGAVNWIDSLAEAMGKAHTFHAKAEIVFDAVGKVADDLYAKLKQELLGHKVPVIDLETGKVLRFEHQDGFVQKFYKSVSAALKNVDWGATGKSIGTSINRAVNAGIDLQAHIDWQSVGKSFAAGIGNIGEAVKAGIVPAFTALAKLPYTVVRAVILSQIGAYKAIGFAIINGLGQGATAGWTLVSAWLASIPGQIIGIFANAGEWLKNVGSALMHGLADGITAAFDKFVVPVLHKITSLIPIHKGPESKDATLLVPAGIAIMRGLQSGMEKGWTPIVSFLSSRGKVIETETSKVVTAAIPPQNLLQQAESQYKLLAQYADDFAFKQSSASKSAGRVLEFYPKGESESFNPQKVGVEVFGNMAKAIDVAGDLTSHYLAKGVDPIITRYYQQFVASMTAKQKDMLQEQYQWAKKNEGEARSFMEWKGVSGIPAFFRGYAFDQWPDPMKIYTKGQIEQFDKMIEYLKTGGAKGVSAIGASLAAANRQLAALQKAFDAEQRRQQDVSNQQSLRDAIKSIADAKTQGAQAIADARKQGDEAVAAAEKKGKGVAEAEKKASADVLAAQRQMGANITAAERAVADARQTISNTSAQRRIDDETTAVAKLQDIFDKASEKAKAAAEKHAEQLAAGHQAGREREAAANQAEHARDVAANQTYLDALQNARDRNANQHQAWLNGLKTQTANARAALGTQFDALASQVTAAFEKIRGAWVAPAQQQLNAVDATRRHEDLLNSVTDAANSLQDAQAQLAAMQADPENNTAQQIAVQQQAVFEAQQRSNRAQEDLQNEHLGTLAQQQQTAYDNETVALEGNLTSTLAAVGKKWTETGIATKLAIPEITGIITGFDEDFRKAGDLLGSSFGNALIAQLNATAAAASKVQVSVNTGAQAVSGKLVDLPGGHIPSFASGGWTGNGSSPFLARLHPRETVLNERQMSALGGGNTVVSVTVNAPHVTDTGGLQRLLKSDPMVHQAVAAAVRQARRFGSNPEGS